MNKNEIIIWLNDNKILNESIKKICQNENHIEDLRSELFLTLCEKSDDEIVSLYESKNMIWWCLRFLKNQYHSKSSPFHKMYRRRTDELDDVIENKSDIEKIVLIEKIEYILDNEIHWFDSHLFKLYYLHIIAENGDIIKPMSLRKIQALHSLGDLSIPIKTIRESLGRTLKIIRTKL
jgi:hypothetical protein